MKKPLESAPRRLTAPEFKVTWQLFALLMTAVLSSPLPMAAAPSSPRKAATALPVRGLHLSAPAKKDLAAAVEFIREKLPGTGVNTLVLEFNYQFNFKSRPEFSDASALGHDDVQLILKACRENQIELIPQFNCLGHQSWAKRTARLLELHPEFDETPGKFPDNQGIYCRSYCPRHPGVHQVVFDLMAELAKACEAKAMHIGMDEVFILADPDCPRCKGMDPAQLFAAEVKVLHAQLKKIGCRTWMWGDRFLDGKATGLGKWEASENGTAPAIDLVPKAIVICDWHYERAGDSAPFFARKGFDVVVCPWRKADVALAQLAQVRVLRASDDPALARRALGMMQTTWCGFLPFAQACRELEATGTPGTNSASRSAHCFAALVKAMRSDGK